MFKVNRYDEKKLEHNVSDLKVLFNNQILKVQFSPIFEILVLKKWAKWQISLFQIGKNENLTILEVKILSKYKFCTFKIGPYIFFFKFQPCQRPCVGSLSQWNSRHFSPGTRRPMGPLELPRA